MSSSEVAWSEATGSSYRSLAGKYMSFFLSKEEYAIDILCVREIISVINITPIPKSPRYVLGVVNLRGKIIPVIDMRRRFQMGSVEETAQACIIVVDMESPDGGSTVQIGCMVDAVSEVLNLQAHELEAAPRCAKVSSEFIQGLGKIDDRVVILLDIEKIGRSIEICGFGDQGGGTSA